MEDQNKIKKAYWCRCLNPKLGMLIKKGSVPKDTGKICPKCEGMIFEEERRGNEDYKEIYEKYIELSKKIFGAGQVQPISGHYESNILPHDEFEKTRTELEPYLEFMSDEELSNLFLDLEIGPKAGAILDERIKKNYLTKN